MRKALGVQDSHVAIKISCLTANSTENRDIKAEMPNMARAALATRNVLKAAEISPNRPASPWFLVPYASGSTKNYHLILMEYAEHGALKSSSLCLF